MPQNNNDDLTAAQQFLADNPDVEIIELMFTDLNGVLRGKWLPRNKLEQIFKWGEFKMPLTTVTFDIWGRDVPALCEDTGDGDGIGTPLVSTLKRVPWLERPTAQMFMQMHGEDSEPFGHDPRVVLKNVCNEFDALGLRPVMAPELEFQLFTEQRDANGSPRIPDTRCNGQTRFAGQSYGIDAMQEQSELLHEIHSMATAMDLPLESLLKEVAPGQYELNLRHLDDPLAVADNMQLTKRLIKGVAAKHGYIASFMAKPFGHEDGNGLHVHTSVLDKTGQNIFDDGSDAGSDKLRYAIAGLTEMMAESMLIFAPHMNSYRRFAAGSHIPMAPTWGYENRDAALRIPAGNPEARRIEHRLAGADANPYLVLAATLSGILKGITEKHDVPPPLSAGGKPAQPALPGNWYAALSEFEQSAQIREGLGEDFQDAFAAIKRHEQAEFSRAISAFEYDTYLVMA